MKPTVMASPRDQFPKPRLRAEILAIRLATLAVTPVRIFLEDRHLILGEFA